MAYNDFLSMVLFLNKEKIAKELQQRPKLIELLGIFHKKFIAWCAVQRTIYEADIDNEVLEFEEKFIKTRLYHVDVKLWKDIQKIVFERDSYTCQYCGKVGGVLEVDHMIPVSKGGTNDLSNLATACIHCNRSKKDKSADEYRKGIEP